MSLRAVYVNPTKAANDARMGPILEKHKQLIARMISPGSVSEVERCIMPTGGQMPVAQQQMQLTVDITPDASGRITLLLTGFIDCPLIQVERDAGGVVSRLRGVQFDAFTQVPDYMRINKIYGHRVVASSVTVENTSKLTEVQGQVEAALVRPNYDFKRVILGDPADGNVQHMWTIDRPPLDNRQIAASQTSYYSGRAEEGVYMVNRLFDVFNPWDFRDNDESKSSYTVYEAASMSPFAVTAGSVRGTLLALANEEYAALPVEKWDSIAATPTSVGEWDADGGYTNHISVHEPSNMQLCVAYFSGLDPTNSFRAKLIMDVEYLVKPGSFFWSFTRPMPPLNLQFILAYAAASYATDNCGPARYNAFADFLKGLNKVFDTIAPVAGAIMSNVPDPRVKAAGTVLSTVSDLKKAIQANNDSNKQTQAIVKPAIQAMQAIATQPKPQVLNRSQPARPGGRR